LTNYVYIATSLDGYIAGKDGDLTWLNEIPNPSNSDFGFAEFLEKIDALVMGRNTYETVLSFGAWPYEKPVFVLSNSLSKVPESMEDKAEIIKGDLKTLVNELKNRGYENLYIDGGRVIQSFLKEDLIDEMIITRVPILLGEGIPLFGKLEHSMKFKLVKTVNYEETYQRLDLKTNNGWGSNSPYKSSSSRFRTLLEVETEGGHSSTLFPIFLSKILSTINSKLLVMKIQDEFHPELLIKIEEQWTTVIKTYMKGAKAEIIEKPDYTLYETGLNNPMWNQVTLKSLNLEKISHQIEEIKSHFEQKGLQFTWFTGPKTQSSILNKHLEKNGLEQSSPIPGMSIDISKIPDKPKPIQGYMVKPVLDEETLEDYIGVLFECFSRNLRGMEKKMPEVIKFTGLSEDSSSRHWVGYLNGEAVGSSAYVLDHGVAGVYNIGTCVAARRKGIGTEMTLLPLRDAKRRGYRIGVLHSSAIGKFVYDKIGFTEQCKIYAYRNPKQDK
jgi:dihydrofolate reductase/ribosomal protein S18 acetylase RimI-like enzyme